MTKQIYGLLLGALLFWGAPLAAEDNLLRDGSFEDYTCNIFGCSWDEWTTPLGQCSANTTDKIDGEASLQLEVKTKYTIDNPVTLGDATYASGTMFEIKMFFKVLKVSDDSTANTIMTDCYWEPVPGGDADAMKQHDANVLQQPLASAVTTDWDSLIIYTTKPEKSAYLRVRVTVPKSTKVLFDAFSVTKVEQIIVEPYITVTPKSVTSVSVNLGESKEFQTIHVAHGNVTKPTTFRIGGTDASHFSLSASSMPIDQEEMDLVVTYAPTAAGSHHANLIFDNEAHTTILPDMIALNGSCVDTTKQPVLTITPDSLPALEAVVGNQVTATVTVSSENCTDFVYMRVDHMEGAAFTIDGTMIAKNTPREVTIFFTPLEEGTFQSTLTVYSEGAESVVLMLNGIGKAATPETVDWATDFQWNETNPLTLLNETFDSIEHNKPLQLDGWQNVAAADARPWWGFDEAETSPVRGEGRYAKATAYQYAKPSTGVWEMWLVTPALDYKNAESKLFAFSVMGEYMPEEGNQALFEVYYIDATGDTAYIQNLTESFSIPTTADENNQWITFHLDLAPFAATIADVFHMAFRYVGPNGDDGAVTYYIDDVSWGLKAEEGIDSLQQPAETHKVIRNGQLLIIRNGIIYNALGGIVE